jgi:monoamine oxidase
VFGENTRFLITSVFMSALSRRAFLAGSAATMAGPALAGAAGAADFDILIIGAGVAGIAAANRVAATGMKCLVLEAGDHLGGRCFTDTRIFGFPYERGAALDLYAGCQSFGEAGS